MPRNCQGRFELVGEDLDRRWKEAQAAKRAGGRYRCRHLVAPAGPGEEDETRRGRATGTVERQEKRPGDVRPILAGEVERHTVGERGRSQRPPVLAPEQESLARFTVHGDPEGKPDTSGEDVK